MNNTLEIIGNVNWIHLELLSFLLILIITFNGEMDLLEYFNAEGDSERKYRLDTLFPKLLITLGLFKAFLLSKTGNLFFSEILVLFMENSGIIKLTVLFLYFATTIRVFFQFRVRGKYIKIKYLNSSVQCEDKELKERYEKYYEINSLEWREDFKISRNLSFTRFLILAEEYEYLEEISDKKTVKFIKRNKKTILKRMDKMFYPWQRKKNEPVII